jgi:glyoxylate reductase
VLTDATADLTIALMLMVTRRLGEGERLLRTGRPWQWGMEFMLGSSLQGRRLGIVGLGQIGQAVARRASAFGMSVAAAVRAQSGGAGIAEADGVLVELLPLDELLATSDVVSLHCPGGPSTHHLIDASRLALLRRDAYLINTARGTIVDEAALADALTVGRLAGAALDVFEHEPHIHPGLLRLDNVVIVPHLGSATVETRTAMAVLAARNVAAVLGGSAPLTPVPAP